MHSCVRWKSTCLKGKGLFLAWFLTTFVAFFSMWACIGFNRRNDAEKCIRLIKLTVFPYACYTVEFCVEFSFLWYSQVQDLSGGWREIHVKNVTKQTQHLHCNRSDNAVLRSSHMHDLGLTVNMLGLCDPSNLLFVLSTEERRTLLKLLWGLVDKVIKQWHTHLRDCHFEHKL